MAVDRTERSELKLAVSDEVVVEENLDATDASELKLAVSDDVAVIVAELAVTTGRRTVQERSLMPAGESI